MFQIIPVKPTRLLTSLSAAALALSVAACGGTDTTTQEPEAGGGETETAAAGNQIQLEGSTTLNGAGASFPAPLYQRWFQDITQVYPDLRVNYQSVGSGAGVRQFTQGTVDFGASDVAMTDEEIQQVERGVLMLPMTAGAIVLAYNVPGVETGLQLSRDVYTNILLGNITNWNDPAIAEANPDADLPDLPITVVHRSDGSGTTGVFTMHLSEISSDWEQQVGQGKTVDWPTGVGAKGNEGITAQIQQTEGAVGYVEYGYASENGLSYASLENSSGNFIEPNEESTSKTLEAVTLPDDLRAFISDPEGEESYPVVTYTWMLAYEEYEDEAKARAMEAMIQYGLTQGQEAAPELGYISLPPNVREKVAQQADSIYPDYQIDVAQTAASN
ncbi:MAG: phosphate ABC transporter substrate-binding protein PstS [Cyanophyceae cyanobacterium]